MAEIFDVTVPAEQEGTKAVVRNWLRKLGETVTLDDPLVELETDKVTQEVPSPVTGILGEILMENGEDALPGAVLGRIYIGAEGGETVAKAVANVEQTAEATAMTEAVHYSPAVRRAAEEYGIDPATINGTGKGHRVTRADMDAAFAAKSSEKSAAEKQPAAVAQLPKAAVAEPVPTQALDIATTAGSRKVPHSPMRLAIANHMLNSVTTAPHVTAVFEADFSAIIRHRDQNKGRLAAEGISLSYTAYIVMACVAAMRQVPEINSRWHTDSLEIFDDINIGVGTALGDKGLVVPVIPKAQHLSLSGTAAKLQDLTNRARSNALTPGDMRGGTFTISNHGVSGSLLASPIIINQPQSAILGVGKLEKRVVVREIDGVDTIQIRPMAYVSLTIDHRSVDGHQTNAWLTHFVKTLESWPA
jgi:2-oxoglutarate dehydrogenase E2 component (dihydrolipoamide succinyltransferase)